MRQVLISFLHPTATNQLDSLRLIENKYSNERLLELTNQLSVIQYLYVRESGTNYDTMVPALCQATQLRVLLLYDIPPKPIPSLTAVLPQFSKLQEIAFYNAHCYLQFVFCQI